MKTGFSLARRYAIDRCSSTTQFTRMVIIAQEMSDNVSDNGPKYRDTMGEIVGF